ncbi:hypothetical protein G6L37_03895 [Agrobacterium rubi]|nr:hypothetical protein [Agrobacterium rubi]NTF24492.1 hypothetical protein [Agrobacterium rubi]
MSNLDDLSAIEDIASLFDGTRLSQDEMESGGEFVDLMYKPMESIFGAVGLQMVKAGWSIFPQELDGNRRPGTVDNEMIKWSERYDLANKKPPLKDLRRWLQQCSSLNVAVVLGPASGDALVIDVDVVEEDLSSQIQKLAVKHFGETPLRRVGRWPKIALVYRQSPDDPISGRSPKFTKTEHPQNPDMLDQGLEIISSGQAMTFFGKHHKTGRYFNWLQETPETVGPDACPVITSEQVGNFLDEVDSLRQFNKSQSLEGFAVSWEWDDSQEIHIPRIRSSGAANSWTENEAGLITDGREAYMRDLCFRVVTANPGIVVHPTDKTIIQTGILKLADIVCQRFSATAEMSGKWQGRSLEREARDRVKRMAQSVASGRITPSVPKTNDKGEHVAVAAAKAYLPPQPRNPNGDSLDFLPPFVDTTKASFDPNGPNQRRPLRIEILPATPEEIEARRVDRAIEEDRTNIANAVSTGLMEAFNKFWDEVYDPLRTTTRVHILKAPTGAGKTSRGMSFISEDPRTKQDYTIRGPGGEILTEGRNPILVLMPTYTNIEELKEKADIYNLDPTLPDAELKKQALDAGLMDEDDLEEKLADIRGNARKAGVETMLYQGKLRAGCLMKEKVELAMSAGIGTSTLCHTPEEKDKDGNVKKPEKFCPFYHQHHISKVTGEYVKCPAIEQKDNIQKSHVVFMPHAFLALNIPEELQNVRAVVADERIHHLFLHTGTFEKNVFLSPRKPPRLTKKEKDAGLDANEFHTERMAAVRMVSFALDTGVDPVEYMLENNKEFDRETGEPVVLRWVRSAIRTCGASMERDANIDPDISVEDLMEICAQPTGKSVREEWRFWKIIEERLVIKNEERPLHAMMKAQGRTPPPSSAKGDRDYRIQLVEDLDEKGLPAQHIRISWRTTPNWVDRPLLLLDASAAPAMISKIWKGKDVQVHDIPAALNVRIVSVVDRTYSNASVVAKPSATPKEKMDSGRLLAQVRKAISTVSALYGWSRVVAGGSIIARKAVNTQWEGPHNVDWCHFGAMRGLDFAKWHAAAISVGRMELPIRTIDGLVAALTYDDDVPEKPYDEKGTGLNSRGQPLMVPTGVQTVRMRSGHDIRMPVPMYPGTWGRMIQKQYREEELLQFLGRVRPVYREGMAPMWFSLSSVIPEEVIVDDLITIEDLLRRGRSETSTYEVIRRCHGILDADIAATVCEDLYASVSAAARHMKSDGYNPLTGEINPRAAWGMIALRWFDGEEEGYSFVRGDVPNPEEVLRNAFATHLGTKLKSVRKVTETLPPTMARGRKSDKIEDALGTLAERRAKEQEHEEAVAIDVLMSTPAGGLDSLRAARKERFLPVMLPSGVIKDEEKQEEYKVNFGEVAARKAIETLWTSMGYTAAKISSMMTDIGMKPDDTHADYSHAAAHTNDAAVEWGATDDYIIPY